MSGALLQKAEADGCRMGAVEGTEYGQRNFGCVTMCCTMKARPFLWVLVYFMVLDFVSESWV